MREQIHTHATNTATTPNQQFPALRGTSCFTCSVRPTVQFHFFQAFTCLPRNFLQKCVWRNRSLTIDAKLSYSTSALVSVEARCHRNCAGWPNSLLCSRVHDNNTSRKSVLAPSSKRIAPSFGLLCESLKKQKTRTGTRILSTTGTLARQRAKTVLVSSRVWYRLQKRSRDKSHAWSS